MIRLPLIHVVNRASSSSIVFGMTLKYYTLIICTRASSHSCRQLIADISYLPMMINDHTMYILTKLWDILRYPLEEKEKTHRQLCVRQMFCVTVLR